MQAENYNQEGPTNPIPLRPIEKPDVESRCARGLALSSIPILVPDRTQSNQLNPQQESIRALEETLLSLPVCDFR